MLWSLVFIGALVAARRRWAFVAELRRDPKRAALLVLAGLLISVNWGVYIWGVNNGHVIETSLVIAGSIGLIAWYAPSLAVRVALRGAPPRMSIS